MISARSRTSGSARRSCAGSDACPHRGLLGHQQHGGRRSVIVQYWRSADALERVAFDAASRSVDVWQSWFGTGTGTGNGAGGRAGFWHETFQVCAGGYTAAYRDVPAIGLLRAGVPAPVTDRRPT